jgi:hypothetical protein
MSTISNASAVSASASELNAVGSAHGASRPSTSKPATAKLHDSLQLSSRASASPAGPATLGSASLTRGDLVADTGLAMLAQANSSPAAVLSLLLG